MARPPIHLYLLQKLLVSRRLQIRLRQAAAARKRPRAADEWPILESAGRPPAGWRGWPEGRAFAFVITHDVDTARGLDRCRLLMDIEERLGFRSAFYFVPRGRYRVPDALLQEMAARGFEVGVHGLYHDWWTFLSRRVFERRAPSIRAALREWGAVGFRAPSMVRNLDWIGELGVEYDASTFDTDPFEPDPRGVGTVFPFRVEGRGHGGYVELPYTLPQDFTAFVLLREQGTAVWEAKLRWLVAQGGLALLDTHPDYMHVEGTRRACDEYPLSCYANFLRHVREAHGGVYWHGLPRELVRGMVRDGRVPAYRAPLRVAMAAYAFYDDDNRIIRYAETLADRGDRVDVFGLARPGQPAEETVRGVRVHRIQTRRRDERGQFAYLGRMLRFFALSSRALWRHHRSRPYDAIHVHSVPDFEVFAAALPRLFGARLILDIHDIVPEFYASKFGIATGDLRFRLLLHVERLSTAFAHRVIIANHLWRDRLVGRSVPAAKVLALTNYADQRIFHPRPRTRADDRFVVLYPGGLQWHQGVDIAIRAFAELRRAVPRAEFHIYGDGPEREGLCALAAELGLEGSVTLHEPVPLRDVPALMANADLGVVAKRANTFGNEAASTKIAEYMSQGLPVLVPRTRIDQYYFDETTVRFFDPGNVADMARNMAELAARPDVRAAMRSAGLAYVARNGWSAHQDEYLGLVDALAARRRAGRTTC